MFNKFKKIIALGVMVMMTVVLLCGCGGKLYGLTGTNRACYNEARSFKVIG